jgi:hypothetical protein
MLETDKLKRITGSLCLCAYNRQGVELWKETGHNLVVESGYNIIAKALSGVSDMCIAKVAVGTNGNEAKKDDVSITDAVIFNISNIEYPYSNAVRFHFKIGYSDCVGMQIHEFGLLTSGNQLFSRRVREQPIEKTNHFSIAGRWDIMIKMDFSTEADSVNLNNSGDPVLLIVKALREWEVF